MPSEKCVACGDMTYEKCSDCGDPLHESGRVGIRKFGTPCWAVHDSKCFHKRLLREIAQRQVSKQKEQQSKDQLQYVEEKGERCVECGSMTDEKCTECGGCHIICVNDQPT